MCVLVVFAQMKSQVKLVPDCPEFKNVVEGKRKGVEKDKKNWKKKEMRMQHLKVFSRYFKSRYAKFV